MRTNWWLFLALFAFSVLLGQEPTTAASRFAVDALLNKNKSKSEAFDFELLQQFLLTAHPNDVSLKDLRERAIWLEHLIEERHDIEGVLFPLIFERPEEKNSYRVNRGGDIAVYTGTYLAGQVFRYLANPTSNRLKKIAKTVDGLYKLTHIAGENGLLCRFAIPLELAIKNRMIITGKNHHRDWYHIYYSSPAKVLPEYQYLKNRVVGFGAEKLIKSKVGQFLTPFEPFYKNQFYYTRTTRDQLTGVIFGLAVTIWAFERHQLKEHKIVLKSADKQLAKMILTSASETALDIFTSLHQNRWKMKDPLTKKAGTSASGVSGLLKLSVQMLARRALMNTIPVSYHGKKTQQEEKNCQRWDRYVSLLRKYDKELLPPGIRRLEGITSLFSSASWFQLTTNYYAWNLRSCRVFAILLLDNVHPDFRPPQFWPAHTLTPKAVNRRNRNWMVFWNNYLWKNIARDSNVWFTYLFNYGRRIVFERHLGKFNPPGGFYSLQKHEFDYWFWWHQNWDELKELRDQVLFSQSFLYSGPKQTLGVGLDRAHFHLRSLAITPVRSYSRPCQLLEEKLLQKYYTIRHNRSLLPPHLRPFSRFWSLAKDPDKLKRDDRKDQIGYAESILIEVPVLYGLGELAGLFDYRYQGFYNYEYRLDTATKKD